MKKRIVSTLIMLFLALLISQSMIHWRAEALFPSTLSALRPNPARVPPLPQQIGLLQRCVALEPANADYRLLLAERLLLRSDSPAQTPDSQQADWEQARRQITQALRLNPVDPRGQVLLGQYFLKKGKIREALASLRRAVALAPNKGQIHGYLGMALVRALTEDPEYRAAYMEDAKAAFQRALALDPPAAQNITYLSSLANLQLATGEPETALPYLQRIAALPFQPDSLFPRLQLASLYLQKGEVGRAVKIYRELLSREDLAWFRPTLEADIYRAGTFYPQAWQVHELLGEIYYSRGNWRGAADHYRQWASLQPQSPEAHFQLGLAYEKLGRSDLSMAQYEDTLRLDPHHSGATQKIIEHYKR